MAVLSFHFILRCWPALMGWMDGWMDCLIARVGGVSRKEPSGRGTGIVVGSEWLKGAYWCAAAVLEDTWYSNYYGGL